MSEQTPPENEIQYWQTVRVQRDICFLYHELSQGGGADLAYGFIYDLPYWDFLEFPLPDIFPEEKHFIRSGCLVMIHAMAWDMIQGSGFYLRDKISHCQQVIARLVPEDEKMARLIEIVTIALGAAQKDPRTIEEHMARMELLVPSGNWVTETFVLGYYKTMFELTTAVHRNLPSEDGER